MKLHYDYYEDIFNVLKLLVDHDHGSYHGGSREKEGHKNGCMIIQYPTVCPMDKNRSVEWVWRRRLFPHVLFSFWVLGPRRGIKKEIQGILHGAPTTLTTLFCSRYNIWCQFHNIVFYE